MKALLVLVMLMTASVAAAQAAEPEDPEAGKPFVLTTLGGETYKNCRIMKVTPAAVTVMHEGGIAKIPFELLDETWRKKFHFDPARAQAFNETQTEQNKKAEEARLAAVKQRREEELRYMEQLQALEKRQRAEEEATTLLGPPLAPAPLPGDPTPQLGTEIYVEEAVPAMAPLGQVYTPGAGTYRMYGRDRYPYYSGYFPYLPVNSSSGWGHHHHHRYSCPVPYVRPMVRGQIRVGGGSVIRVTR